jgi:signal transduction histidine kinase
MRPLLFFFLLLLGGSAAAQADDIQKMRDSAQYYKKIAIQYGRSGKNDSSIMNSLHAMRLFEILGDKKEMGVMHWALAAIYSPLRQYDKAEEHADKGMLLSREMKDWSNMGLLLMTKSAISVIRKKEYTEDVYFMNKEAYSYFEKTGERNRMADAMNNIGTYFSESEKHNYDSAIYYYGNALDIQRSLGNKSAIGLIEDNLSRLYFLQKNYTAARDHALASLAIHEPLRNYRMLKKNYLKLVNLYALFNQPDSVAHYGFAYQKATDSMFSDRLSKNLADAEARYETEKKKDMITLLNKTDSIKSLQINNQQLVLHRNLYLLAQQQLKLADDSLALASQQATIFSNRLDSSQKEEKIRSLNRQALIQQLEIDNESLDGKRKDLTIFAISAVAALAGLSGLFGYKRFRSQKEKQLQQVMMEQQDLAARSILSAEENERNRIAGDLHDGVGQVMSAAKMNLSAIESELRFNDEAQRQRFEKIISLVDESCREVRAVSHNMMPNALIKSSLAGAVREFINQVDARVLKINLHTEGLNETTDSNTEAVLYRVIQECVNNVIKHAHAQQLDISLIRDQDGISVTIEDNGRGFSPSATVAGIGLKNVRTRINYLKGTVEWDTAPGKGTVVGIWVPV